MSKDRIIWWGTLRTLRAKGMILIFSFHLIPSLFLWSIDHFILINSNISTFCTSKKLSSRLILRLVSYNKFMNINPRRPKCIMYVWVLCMYLSKTAQQSILALPTSLSIFVKSILNHEIVKGIHISLPLNRSTLFALFSSGMNLPVLGSNSLALLTILTQPVAIPHSRDRLWNIKYYNRKLEISTLGVELGLTFKLVLATFPC